MSNDQRLFKIEPLDKRIWVKVALKVFLDWFHEKPFWWTALVSCMLITFGSQIISGYLLISGNFDGFVNAWVIGWIALMAGLIPLIKLFARYL